MQEWSWAGLPRVLPGPRVAVERVHVPWRTSWQGCFSRVVSELSLPGNPSDVFAINPKCLKKLKNLTGALPGAAQQQIMGKQK